jgi:hypothetical protein
MADLRSESEREQNPMDQGSAFPGQMGGQPRPQPRAARGADDPRRYDSIERLRTPAEQADFDARVAAEVTRKRVEAEKGEVDAAAAEQHDAQTKRTADIQASDLDARKHRDEERARQAEFDAHPHTQIMGVVRSLQTPAIDLQARIGQLHHAVSRLAHVMLSGVEPPAPLEPLEKPDVEKQRIEEQPAGWPLEQEPIRR